MVALLYATPLFAQFDFPSFGGRGAAMGGVSVALDDEVSAMYNISALNGIESAAVAISARQSFVVDGMGVFSLGGIVPLGFGSMAATVEHFGDNDYNEQRVSLAYALPLGRTMSFGVAFHYMHSGTSDPYYEPLNRLTFSTALRFRPSDDFTVAFKAFNPSAGMSDSELSLRIPAVFSLGVSYRIIDELLAVGEVEKNLYEPSTLRFGLEYLLQEGWFIRVGVNTRPAIYTFGLGLRQGRFGADLAAQFHNVLGLTPQLSLQYRF